MTEFPRGYGTEEAVSVLEKPALGKPLSWAPGLIHACCLSQIPYLRSNSRLSGTRVLYAVLARGVPEG
jgi:hypothetical protein